ncbi:MAG: peptidylprolyl isomerase [Bacteroidales bacterium]|nr:peptidylprolyl isomerase [Bacteroidales bacterium]
MRIRCLNVVLLFCGFSGCGVILNAQSTQNQSVTNDPIVVTAGKDKVTMSQLRQAYIQNNDPKKATDQQIRDYLALYVDYLLKCQEAESKQLDTLPNIQKEFASYRNQASVQNLTDKEVTQNILNEAVERAKWDLRASHILKQVYSDALPADTLKAYKEILKIREQLLKGSDFGKMATELSDDPSAKNKLSASGEIISQGNGGDLGYFTVFDMIYEFENGAYQTPVGQISQPIRTNFGYHLIYVKEKKPAMGKVKAQQILIPYNKSLALDKEQKISDETTAHQKIQNAYQDLQNGMKFADAIKKYTPNSVSSDLSVFGCNRYEGDFISGLYGLKIGEFSKPIKSSYGWHIVFIDTIYSPETDTNAVAMHILRDSRSDKSKDAFIERVKKEKGFQELIDKKSKVRPVEDFYTIVDTSLLSGNWDINTAVNLHKDMFIYDGKTYNQQDFARFLRDEQSKFQKTSSVADMPVILNYLYRIFEEKTIYDYENQNLEKNNPKFAALMKDYKDGLLLYELTDQRIWRKADADSLTLDPYYQQIKDKYLYPVRVEALLVRCVDSVTAVNAVKYLNKGKTAHWLKNQLNKKSITALIDTVVYYKGQNANFDKLFKWTNVTEGFVIADMAENEVVRVEKVLQPSPKAMEDVKGIVMAAYQADLEKKWTEELHSNNKIEVDYATIFRELRK